MGLAWVLAPACMAPWWHAPVVQGCVDMLGPRARCLAALVGACMCSTHMTTPASAPSWSTKMGLA